MNYQEAQKEFVKARNKEVGKKLTNNTWLRKEEDDFCIRLYDTDIIRINPDDIQTLNHGGWITPTTKDRLNKYSYGSISQAHKVWYVSVNEQTSEFFNGIQISKDGIVNALNDNQRVEQERKRKILEKLVKRYVDGFKKLIEDDKLEYPSGGDCWYCAMTTEDGRSLGDASQDDSHILSHLKDQYFVPSLLFNAIKSCKYGKPEFMYQHIKQRKDGNRARQILRKYFRSKEYNLLKFI